MSDTPNYVEYRPPADGVAPPYWREGMRWSLDEGQQLCGGIDPLWRADAAIYVEPEALIRERVVLKEGV